MDNYSLSDIAAASGNNEGFGGSWWIIVLFLFAMMGGGMGFGQNGATATKDDVYTATQRAVDFQALERQNNEIMQNTSNVGATVTTSIKDGNYNLMGEMRDIESAVATNGANIINNLTALQSNMQSCCCETQRAIDGVNYNLATQSAAIQANDTANTQKILDALSTNRMADMQNQINQLQLQNAVSGVVRYPMASTYSSGSNPFCGCGCSGAI